ncbi:ribosomal large subunit pseudouridine synthase D [Treponema primitia ZAS-2]|uniref:Pseudouridine synthase n=1 Tax=Treponema primitia (strain ATCC BAA-887 / DSM 12427 / ZAS-2) TaxID=545694 RepID=F5YIY4_TREPZ|nr:RluA family pseudouridine synthase [Treponema primitia]AEF86266.1 ribosomal large subunit pseudouridine synthase D [Treponema primitia ZAS-2]
MPDYSGTVEGDFPGGLRLDRYVAEEIKLLTRSQLKTKLLQARLNGKLVKLSRPVKPGDLLELSWAESEPLDLIPENIPLELLYEDDRVIVLNKAQGMVVHPGAGNHSGTLANALLYRRLTRPGSSVPGAAIPGNLRPGIVHRLDKDTSGVIIAAWDDAALAFLADQFKARTVKKTYIALVQGTPKETQGVIETRIVRDSRDRKRFTVSFDKGKAALTRYRVIRSWGAWSLLLLQPKTGRTHQIRVHLRHLGHPILGDPIYGAPVLPTKFPADKRFPGVTLMLHARTLSITLPGMAEPSIFKAPLPERFREIIRKAATGK